MNFGYLTGKTGVCSFIVNASAAIWFIGIYVMGYKASFDKKQSSTDDYVVLLSSWSLPRYINVDYINYMHFKNCNCVELADKVNKQYTNRFA